MHMRPAPLLPFAILFALVLVGCSSAAPGWTYAPAPSATPAPSGAGPSAGASAGASGGASGAPSAGASGAPSPAGSGAGSTAVVNISASGVKFEQSELTVAAGAPFQIQFENKDAGTPHNVAIHQGGPTGPELFKGEIFNGVATKAYDVPALDAGAYSFVCTVHPTMTGTLTAQ